MEENAAKITLNVEGMDCSSCALGITNSLTKLGLKDVNVNFATGEAVFKEDKAIELTSVVNNIEGLGYKVIDSKKEETGKRAWTKVEKLFYFSLLFTVPLFLHMFLPFHFLHHPLVQLGLSIPVVAAGMYHFGKSALGSLRSGVPNMDVLITIGAGSAFVYSLAGTILYHGLPEVSNFLFYETAATIITLVLLGNVIEHRSVKQTTTAIKDLSALQEGKAKLVVIKDGKEEIEETAIEQIIKYDVVVVNTGDRIPVDGEVVSGTATVDESMLTGESIPAEKAMGDAVTGGTILVSGNLRVKTKKVGKETVLAHIIELVKNAQNTKPSIQKLGDKVSAVFVPAVVGIAVLTFVVSYFAAGLSLQSSLMHSIAVLVISCPCAMGLATPTAVMAGLGRAAKKGILIKGGQTLEEFAQVKKVVFDKTGTLTTGKFSIKKIVSYNGTEEQKIIDLLYALEKNSSHPIAKSLVENLKSKAAKVELSNVKEEKGLGISATDKEGTVIKAGSFRIAENQAENKTHNIYLTINGKLAGAVDLEDEIQPYAKEAIGLLNAAGIETIMLSGDKKERCDELAAKLGIKKVYSEQSPAQKLEIVDQLSQTSKIAMVGDGINDAPALAKAQVGISLSNATQVAVQSAGIILLGSSGMKQLYEALLVSKHTLKTIKQNLFWAFFYNVIAIPIAAFGFLNPMVGALSMAFSDVIVIGNSIWLKTKKLD
jgi:P-type Cu+ transporter